ncbi:MAG: class II fructose-bisphosphate aldolase, partial [Rickettsiales bacterium]|nr:class II fructose-bisphosphate aldolase [Rickettsiales bacterium]
MLTNTNEMLSRAQKHRYAVPGFNFYNLETLQSIVAAAEQTAHPVILSVSEGALKYMGADTCVAMVKSRISNLQSPISLHLDHGRTFDACKTAIDAGFTSVMIDASDKPFDENVALTRAVADYAHKHNVSVEGELGSLTGFEEDAPSSFILPTSSLFTNPEQSSLFISLSGVDSLAVSIGTSHGAYKMPKLPPCGGVG